MRFDNTSSIAEIFSYIISGSNEEMELRCIEYFEAVYHDLHLNNPCMSDPMGEAKRITRSNIGYMAGYYDSDVRKRVEDVLNIVHPIFGSYKREWTNEEIFEMGKQWAIGESDKKTLKMKLSLTKK